MISELEKNLLRRENMGDDLRRSAQRVPDKTAIHYYYLDGRHESVNYQELNERVNKVANNLLKRGVKKGDRVAILCRNNISFVVLGYALNKIGAWLAPINFMLIEDDIEYLINYSGANWFFVEDNLKDKIDGIQDKLSCVEQYVQITTEGHPLSADWIDFNTLLEGGSKEPRVIIESDDVATLFFTSGTESRPKGVLCTHANFHATMLCYSINFGINNDDTLLLSLPLMHMAGFTFTVLGLANTMTLVMTQMPVPSQMVALMDKHKITATALPPILYLAIITDPDIANYDLSHARKLMTWSSTIPQSMIDGWKKLSPEVRFFSGQGSSESTAGAITGGYIDSWETLPNQDGRFVGQPSACGADVRLVDEDGNDVAVGESGEQIIRGAYVMKGYYKNDAANQKAFKDGWFHTGDVLFRDADNNYYFADRKKDMIKTGGENVFCQEVESVIGIHPAVLLCAVFGLPDEQWGEAVTAAIVLKPDTQATEADIIEFCRERMAGFKTPKKIYFRDALPISAANKILKRKLKEEYM